MYTSYTDIDDVKKLPDDERRYFEYDLNHAEFEKHYLFEGYHDLIDPGEDNYYFLKIYYDLPLDDQYVREGAAPSRNSPFYCALFDSDGELYSYNDD